MPEMFPIHRPVNVMQNIVNAFLEGAPFTEQLCDKVAATYSYERVIVSYKRSLEFVKSILNQSKRYSANSDIYVIETPFEFNDLEIALAVRLYNLSYHGAKILVINNSIVYIPKDLLKHTEEEIRIHVYKTIQDQKPGPVAKFFSALTAKFKGSRRKKVTVGMHLASS